jgi:hypothetical protein
MRLKQQNVEQRSRKQNGSQTYCKLGRFQVCAVLRRLWCQNIRRGFVVLAMWTLLPVA